MPRCWSGSFNLRDKLLMAFASALSGQRKVGVALSGGVDSMVLVRLLQEHLGRDRIVTFTVDHRLRKESAEEASKISSIMKSWGTCDSTWSHHLLARSPLGAAVAFPLKVLMLWE